MHAFVHRKGCVACEPVLDSSRQLLRPAGPRVALARLVFPAGQRRWPGRMLPEAQPGRCGKGPLAVRGADGLARGARAWARGGPGPLAQAAG